MTAKTAGNGAATTASLTSEREPMTKFESRIGSTVYQITVHPNPNATETLEQKLLRLIESEVRKSA
jgi:hypothetical protein